MDKVVISASHREVLGKKVKEMRRDGKLPAVLYGKSLKPIAIIMDLKEATSILKATSSSSLLTIDLDGKEYTTLVRERQRDLIRGNYLHIDFLAVSLTEKVRAKVTITIEGQAPALETYESLLTTGLDRIEVESLPQDLPERITVDVSSLNEIGDGIYVRDIELPPNVETLHDMDDMIVVVSALVIVEEEEEEELEEELELEGEPGELEEGAEEAAEGAEREEEE